MAVARNVVIVIMAGSMGLAAAGVASAQTTQPVTLPSPASVPVSAAASAPASAPAAASAVTQQAPLATPSTRPINKSVDDTLRQMLQPQAQAAQPLQPLPDLPNPETYDLSSGPNAVPPGAATQPLTPEGTALLDKIGRLTPSADGKTFEFTFESDGIALADPPLVLAPNKRLEQLEQQVANSYADLRLRVSGEILEYKGRNYLLLSKWAVLPDTVRPLQ